MTGLECLILTCDPTVLNHIQASLHGYGPSLHFRQDVGSAMEFASRRHLDGFIIDCDSVAGGKSALAQIRNTSANKQTLILAIVNGSMEAEAALGLGANFILSKPIQETRLRGVLPAVVAKMEREHRKYFRYDVTLPVRFQNSLEQSFTATMKNISEGGMAINLVDPVRLKGVVVVEFELPSIESQTFRARADVVWNDSFVVGLRFLCVEKDCGVTLQAWLNSLEAQLRFRESAKRTS
jgi:CheY-like chemotaxis protein